MTTPRIDPLSIALDADAVSTVLSGLWSWHGNINRKSLQLFNIAVLFWQSLWCGGSERLLQGRWTVGTFCSYSRKSSKSAYFPFSSTTIWCNISSNSLRTRQLKTWIEQILEDIAFLPPMDPLVFFRLNKYSGGVIWFIWLELYALKKWTKRHGWEGRGKPWAHPCYYIVRKCMKALTAQFVIYISHWCIRQRVYAVHCIYGLFHWHKRPLSYIIKSRF